ncbi:MAG: SAM-dependent methyltransferase, partial [Gaiellaceae bacterium]
VTRRGGTLYVLCFSDTEPDTAGPHPVTEEGLRAPFRSGWSVVSVSRDRVQSRFNLQGAPAWLARIERT